MWKFALLALAGTGLLVAAAKGKGAAAPTDKKEFSAAEIFCYYEVIATGQNVDYPIAKVGVWPMTQYGTPAHQSFIRSLQAAAGGMYRPLPQENIPCSQWWVKEHCTDARGLKYSSVNSYPAQCP